MSRLNGRDMLAVFDEEVTRRDAARRFVENRIATEERKISSANAEREAAYAELAEMYAADDGKLAADFGEISQRLQAIFDEKMGRRRAVNELLDQAAALISQVQAQLPAAQEAVRVAQEKFDAARRETEADLEQDSAYRVIKSEDDAARGAAQQLAATADRIRTESETKLAAFNANRLFRYLVSVHYGTPDYRGRGWIASGDRRVAQLVAWDRNHPSFTLLEELPGFARRRADEAKKRAELTTTKVSFYVHEREVAHQVDATGAALAAAEQGLKQLQGRVAELEDQRAKLMAEIRDLDSGADSYQKQAKAEMKRFLAVNPITVLKARAEKTASPRDNELVARIEAAENAINEGRSRVKNMVAERAEAEVQHERAVRARRHFSSNYTGTYDQFNRGFNLGDLLTGYIIGSTTERLLWGGIDQHHYNATPTFSYDPSSSSSNSGGFSIGGFGGGGDSGGGFSFGGGDSGGGFATGGGS